MSNVIFNVFFDRVLAGTLSITHAMVMSFKYDEAYASTGGTPISLVMPVSSEPYGDEIVFPFVENLFPEGEVRRLIMESNKIPEANFEKFLSLMGNDVAGALSFQAEGCKPEFELPGNPVTYEIKELSQILLDIQDRPFFVGVESKAGNRMSLAGAQHKLPVLMIDGKICDSKGSPTTHLIKPAPKKKAGENIRFPSLVYNEFVCMRAAKAAQINTANVTLLDVYDQDGNESDALLIERYDRIVGKSVKRLQQEDLCQVTSVPSPKKYEVDGGPGFIELFEVIDTYSSIKVLDNIEAFKRMIFNIIIGNNDAHAKNFSFLIDEHGKVGLTPAYDLVCTQLYEDLSDTFAMAISGKGSVEALQIGDIEALFDNLNKKKYKTLRPTLMKYADNSLKSIQQEVEKFEQGDFYNIDIKNIKRIGEIASTNHRLLTEKL